MNLKQSFRIIDSRRGEVRKPSRIRDNGWRGFIDTPDDQKADYLWNYANEQEELDGELTKMKRDFVDVFAKEKPSSVIYESDEDGGGINYYDTLNYAKWSDPDFKEVYAKNIRPFESDLNRRTADINMMNEYLGYPIGFESGHKPYWIKKQGIGDSARVNDMAIRDMAVRFKEGIDAVAEDWKSAFIKKHPELQNIFNEKENAVDFFDTARYLVSRGQEEELQRELNELGRQYYVYCKWKWIEAEKESDCCLEIAKASGGDDRLYYYPYTNSLVCYGATFDSDSNDRQLNHFQRNYESIELESPDAQLINFLDEFFDWVATYYGTNEVAQ